MQTDMELENKRLKKKLKVAVSLLNELQNSENLVGLPEWFAISEFIYWSQIDD